VREITLARSFDLIWCGSLFTHLDRVRWPHFLGFFADQLAPGGVLVFTTHGRQVMRWMMEGVYHYGLSREEQRALIRGYATQGIGSVSPSSQAFGISLSSAAFVITQLERWPLLTLIGMHEAGWAGHRDVISCVRLRTPYPSLDAMDW
jgi:hypothetical protein